MLQVWKKIRKLKNKQKPLPSREKTHRIWRVILPTIIEAMLVILKKWTPSIVFASESSISNLPGLISVSQRQAEGEGPFPGLFWPLREDSVGPGWQQPPCYLLPADLLTHPGLAVCYCWKAATLQKPVWCSGYGFRLRSGKPRFRSLTTGEADGMTLGLTHSQPDLTLCGCCKDKIKERRRI